MVVKAAVNNPGPASWTAATKASSRAKSEMTARDYVELSSIEEYRKFRKMPPISKDDVLQIDLDELARRLTD